MKIQSYDIENNILVVYFDTAFKQINYIKMESSGGDSECGNLECEEMEIKYSKRKNTLNLFTNGSSNTTVLLITEFDKRDTCYAYYIKCKKSKGSIANSCMRNESDNFDALAKGFTTLLKKDISDTSDMGNDKICSIKNQNIFAKITRKD